MPSGRDRLDEGDWRDAGFGSGRLVELTPAERKARDRLQREGMKEAGEAAQKVLDNLTAPRKPTIIDAALAVEVAKASELPTEQQKRARQLGYEIQPDGSWVSSKLIEARRKRAEHEEHYAPGSPTPEETRAFEREVGIADDDDSMWQDVPAEDDDDDSYQFVIS
jgi:hypothetical protein